MSSPPTSQAPGPTVVEVLGVAKSYRRGSEEVHALQDVSLTLRAHEVVALVGPSGSGKTTLLNLLCGWEAPDAGEILWSDGRPATLADRQWSDLAIVPQSLGLMEDLTIRENVELPARLRREGEASGNKVAAKAKGKDRATRLLRGLGLDALADRDPREASMGEQQRAALARALALSPRLLLADEPTGHQDADWARGVFRAIRFAAGEGSACLVATHNREAVVFADRVLAIRDGRVHAIDGVPA